MQHKPKKTAIIGAGNLGSAIALGFIKSGYLQAAAIHITRRSANKLEALSSKGFITGSSNTEATENADVVILAVKPWQIADVLSQIKPALKKEAIIVSLAAGITLNDLSQTVNNHPLFRVIPNTAIAIGQSMTCISSQYASDNDIAVVNELFQQVGDVMMIPENLMPAVTVIASCGTAYALRYLHASAQGGVESGIKPADAIHLAAQTMKGAAELILASGNHPEAEIDKVTTPGGITIKGLNEMEHQGFSSSIIKGMMTAMKSMQK